MRNRDHLRSLSGLLTITACLGGEPGGQAARPEPAVGRAFEATPQTPGSSVPALPPHEALTFSLAEAPPPEELARPPRVSAPEPLSDTDVEALLAKLPNLEGSEPKSFAFRDSSLKRPRAGSDVETPFPPKVSPPRPLSSTFKSAPDPLRVVRATPEGTVEYVPQVTVSFSAPMVPLSSVDEVAKTRSPATLSPSAEGEWRWLDTQTIQFKVSEPLRLSTEYRVRVPQGTLDVLGGRLPKAFERIFETPRNQFYGGSPGGDQNGLDPRLTLSFAQPVRPASILPLISVTADGRPVPVRLAKGLTTQPTQTVELELNGGKRSQPASQSDSPGAASSPLRPDVGVHVRIAPGIPSIHGPLRSREGGSFDFRTYPRFRITGSSCSSYECRPHPGTTFSIGLSNPIDAKRFDPALVSIRPELPEAKVSAAGQSVIISGNPASETQYTITLPSNLGDVWGQTLEGPRSASFQTSRHPGPEPRLDPTYSRMLVLDPNAPKTYEVTATNHEHIDVELYRMEPNDWERFEAEFVGRYFSSDEPTRSSARMPGRLVSSTRIKTRAPADQPRKASIDFTPALSGGLGQLVILVKGADWMRSHVAWIQVTRLGLSAYVDSGSLAAFVSDLRDGSGRSGAKVTLRPTAVASARHETSSSEGIARFAFVRSATFLSAELDGDSTFLPSSYFGDQSLPAHSRLVWYTLDDRKLYRPGEKVHIKGWIRSVFLGKGGDLRLPPKLARLSFRLVDAQGVEITSGTAETDGRPGFDLAVDLPDAINLGTTSLELSVKAPPKDLEGTTHTHSFQVEEFRKPEFEVRIAPDEPYLMSKPIVVPVEAKYYAGGPLPFAPTTWHVTSSPSTFSPPNLPAYTFGRSVPRFRRWDLAEAEIGMKRHFHDPSPAVAVATLSGRTGRDGAHRLSVVLSGELPPWPVSLSLTAAVTDTNLQRWQTTGAIQLHPSELYLGLRSPRQFVELGEPVIVDAVVSDLTGALRAGKNVEIHGFFTRSVPGSDGIHRAVEADAQSCKFGSLTEATRCVLHPHEAGALTIRGIVRSPEGRPETATEISVWVAGAPSGQDRSLSQQQLFLLADQRSYVAGEVAKLAVQSPFHPAEGILTIDRTGIITQTRFTMRSGTHVLSIPLYDEHTPGFRVMVHVFGATARVDSEGVAAPTLPTRPAFASGELELDVRPDARTLAVRAIPKSATVEPGAKTVIDVEVRDPNGRPLAGADVALIAADEAVLALAGYTLPDPFEVLLMRRPHEVRTFDSRSLLILSARPEATTGKGQALALPTEQPSADSGREAESAPKAAVAGLAKADARAEKRFAGSKDSSDAASAKPTVKVRSSFDPLLVFRPSVVTDAAGRATVEVTVPDSLTRYRIMAVAAHGQNRFGLGESTLTARRKLMIRPSPPRFLSYGDHAEIPILIQNLDPSPIGVKVALRGLNATLRGPKGYAVEIAANDRIELRFPVDATSVGRASFQLIAEAPAILDAAEVSFPVWTPATAEAFATYGTIDEGSIAQVVQPPSDAASAFGGLEITTSATALAELTDAFLYLYAYPYECSEQLSSRLLGVLSLKDVLAAFGAEGLPGREELEAAIGRDLDSLRRRQNSDGGWDFWNDESVPYVSIHATHAALRAKLKGVTLPAGLEARALAYLSDLEAHIAEYEARYRFHHDPTTRAALIAYGLYVRALAGEDVSGPVRALFASMKLKDFSLETQGWMLGALGPERAPEVRSELLRNLGNRVEETAERAHFVSRYDEGAAWILASEHRSDAVVLDGLVAAVPTDPLIPKVVRGLLAHRLKGRWGNTQENVFVLVALERYFSKLESVTPDFVARAWLGDDFAGEQEFRGRTAVRQNLMIPMAVLKSGASAQSLLLSKEGPGRLYYRLGLRYAPEGLKLDGLDRGFRVSRSYQSAGDPGDVVRLSDGTWRIRPGATVRVTLSMQAPSQRFHVALVDKLPGGLEPLNPALAAAGPPPTEERRRGLGQYWWSQNWHQHQNVRDERVEAFTTQLWPGAYTYSYLARATTRGRFVAAPAHAEEMYAPETFGRTPTDLVAIEAD
ncbi:MAG: hypothetical protein HYV07_19840 [Deltaproteobacteria bacterium]|nr:hypothetical protein [Deltaproteobacteria bacterium]